MLDLTVSIVNHRHRDLLGPLLESIQALTHHISYEVFVVDNASNDGSVEMVKSRFPWVHLLCNDQPMGFAANHNQVLRQGQGRYLILLNDDMLLRNDALDHMVAFMDSHPSVGAVGCKLLNRDGSLQRSCWRQFPSPKTLLIDTFYLSKWLPQLSWVREFEATLQDTGEPIEVDYLLGACLMVRREVLEQVGVLDESYFMFLEETDWCYRIKQAGWAIFWIPDGEIIHYGQQSVSGDPERYVPMLYRNYCRFGRKHGYNQWKMLALKATLFFGVLFRSGLWTYRSLINMPNSSAMMRGYLKTLRDLPSF